MKERAREKKKEKRWRESAEEGTEWPICCHEPFVDCVCNAEACCQALDSAKTF